jgi:hypothetical protein
MAHLRYLSLYVVENFGKKYSGLSTYSKQLIIISLPLEDLLYFCSKVHVYEPAE